MSIDSDAQKDLALTDEDAEGVVGGKKQAKKHKAETHPAAAHTVSYSYSPGATGPATSTTDDEDCDQPGYAGSGASDMST